jgi:HSP20 family protein
MEYFPETTSQSFRSPFFSYPLRAFEEVFGAATKPWFAPQRFAAQNIPLDVAEFADKYIVKADLPGIEREDVDISFENSNLTLRVEVEREEEKKDTFFLLRERLYTTSVRSFPLPLADSKGVIDAKMKEGVLTISIPKRIEKQTRKIEIH